VAHGFSSTSKIKGLPHPGANARMNAPRVISVPIVIFSGCFELLHELKDIQVAWNSIQMKSIDQISKHSAWILLKTLDFSSARANKADFSKLTKHI